MQGEDELRRTLRRIDGRGYKAYGDIRGAFELGDVELYVDHVQGDPFATPSKLRVRVPMARAALPAALFAGRVRRLALCDWLARRVRDAIARGERGGRSERGGGGRRGSGSGKSGQVEVDAGGQAVLERTAVVVTPSWVEARLRVGLPAAGRRILGGEAESLLCARLPEVALRALCPEDDAVRDEGAAFVGCVENQEHLRGQLRERGLVAFVGEGAVLPRESGVSDRPLRGSAAVPFETPASLRVELSLLHPLAEPGGPRRALVGMGIPRGVSLVVGGGYHGKSTLLRALERGVHPHVPGDGREWVVSDPGLVKIRAEDGRRVEQVDIAAFISDLPGGRDTARFQSEDASGSTSQAANIAEAVEAGASGLLLDEDTCATNFMVRDARMQALVAAEHEPITPFLDRVRELYDALGVSTVLVMGGCGDYFDVADRVIAMREYRPRDVTAEARRVAAEHDGGRRREVAHPLTEFRPRVPLPQSLDPSRGRRDVRIEARGRDRIEFGRESIDLRGVEQLVEPSQTRAAGQSLRLLAERLLDGETPLREALAALEALLDEQGLDVLDPFHRPGRHPGNFARPRVLEVAAALNRLRTLRVRPP